MCTMFMSPYMERGYTCSILYICGDHPLSELAYLACGRGPHVRDKVPMKGLGSMMMHVCFDCISIPIVV